MLTTSWLEWPTKRGPVEIRTAHLDKDSNPTRIHVRKKGDKTKFISLPFDGFLGNYESPQEALEAQVEILFV